ncbi:CshA/CshB family fibrillar adhesin-related protein [Bifidobacterium sp. ESL0790]|uniref:CshA/CshB family fibrillar adhesin-related protein n=1 Tax=Bifidobacterium sp. ESL0790 TaxID=2983233 RepID=UPI0023F66063|nr:CshA/CshB family fibrillar adhesin-related protein [Bifidobacterium sp. ESL0790]WEV72438.1 CshA/CshB family fibrillar adhesin-related protein [Bifidobacterium sp. ESL0790]
MAGFVGALSISLAGIVASGTASANPSSEPSVGPRIIATGGDGRMLNDIDWVQWSGTDGETIDGDKIVWTTPSKVGDDHWLSTRCAVTTPGGGDNPLSPAYPIKAYRSGGYSGDGLPYMYNQGGSGGSNTMVTGLANSSQGEKVTFDFTCDTYLIDSTTSPSLDSSTNPSSYTAVPMQGLVFADAESNNWNWSQSEYIKATPQTQISSATPVWRLLDSYREPGCGTNSVAELNGNTMRFRSDNTQCSSSVGGAGPASVMFLQGSQSARVTLKGGGVTAVALGSIALSDFGDAPESYGVASSVFQPQWTGGALGTDISGTPYSTADPYDPDTSMVGGTLFNLSDAKDSSVGSPSNLAKTDEPTPQLGEHEDSESDVHYSTDANWDDTNGVNDEDGLDAIARDGTTGNIKINPASDGTFTQKVACQSTAAAEVKGWIDWDHDGHFDNTDEGSDQQACVADSSSATGSSATLTWNVPADAQRAVKGEGSLTQSFERVRITAETDPMSTNIMRLTPTGVTTSGEVEDYAVDVHVPMLNVRVNLPDGRHDPLDQFRISTKNSSSVEVDNTTTTGAASNVQSDQIGPKYFADGTDYTVSAPLAGGSVSTESRYSNNLSCVDLAHGNAVVTTDANGKFTMPADSNVQCTFTRSVRSNPTLKVTTHVNGGSAIPSDFPTVATLTPGGGATALTSGSPVSLTEGSYKITTDMTGKPNYEVTSPLACTLDSSPISLTDATVALANGQNVVCDQTVAPKAATLTLKTEVERGDAQPSDFDFTVATSGGSTTYTENNPQTSAGGITGVTGSSVSGYDQDGDIVYYKNSDTTHSTQLTLAQANAALADGESVTGIRKVTNHTAKFIVHLTRDYNYGGTAAGDGSEIKLKPQGGSESAVTLDTSRFIGSGVYSVEQLLHDGYEQTNIKVTVNGTEVTIASDGTFTVPADADVVVELKNKDKPGELQWDRTDIDTGALLPGSEWTLYGPDSQSLDVPDCTAGPCTGLDQDPTPGKFSVTGLKWGRWTIAERTAPAGYGLVGPQDLTLDPSEGQSGLLKSTLFRNGTPVDIGSQGLGTGDGTLSSTGVNVFSMTAIAVAALACGLVLNAWSRRPKPRHAR